MYRITGSKKHNLTIFERRLYLHIRTPDGERFTTLSPFSKNSSSRLHCAPLVRSKKGRKGGKKEVISKNVLKKTEITGKENRETRMRVHVCCFQRAYIGLGLEQVLADQVDVR